MKLLGVPDEVTYLGESMFSRGAPSGSQCGNTRLASQPLLLTGHLRRPSCLLSPADSGSVLVAAVFSSKSQQHIISHQNYTMTFLKLWTFSSISTMPLSRLTRVKNNLSIFDKIAIFSNKVSLQFICSNMVHRSSVSSVLLQSRPTHLSPCHWLGAETSSIVLQNVSHSESVCFPVAFFLFLLWFSLTLFSCELVNQNVIRFRNVVRMCVHICVYVYINTYICIESKSSFQLHVHIHICILVYTHTYLWINGRQQLPLYI